MLLTTIIIRQHKALCATVLCAAAGMTVGAQPQVFRGGVDLVVIETTVVQQDGSPLADLLPEDFVVKVDGNPRRVVSVQFVRAGQSSAAPSGGAPAGRPPSAEPRPLTADGGRLIAIVFDRENIRAGLGRGAAQALGGLLDRLQPDDRVGLLSIPPPGTSIDFTTEHDRVRSALDLLAGSLNPTWTRFRIGLKEAREISRGSLEDLEAVRLRECSGEPSSGSCPQLVEVEAKRLWSDAQRRGRASLSSLGGLVRDFGRIEGPKALVVLTEGLVADAFTSELRRLALEAGRTRVTLYVLHLDAPLFEAASDIRRPISAVEDADIVNDGVRTLAAATGGAYLRVIASPAGAVAQIERELSAYYLIGVEPTARDRDGKPHRIDVAVRRPGVTVRSRREFTMSTR